MPPIRSVRRSGPRRPLRRADVPVRGGSGWFRSGLGRRCTLPVPSGAQLHPRHAQHRRAPLQKISLACMCGAPSPRPSPLADDRTQWSIGVEVGVGDRAVVEMAYFPLPLLPLALLALGVAVGVAVEPELLDRSSEPPELPEPSDPEPVPDVAEPEPLPSEPLPDEPEPLLISSEPCEPDEPEPLVPSPEPEPGAAEPRLLSSEPDEPEPVPSPEPGERLEPEVPGWSPASWLARPSGPPELGPPELLPPASFDGLGETAGAGCL